VSPLFLFCFIFLSHAHQLAVLWGGGLLVLGLGSIYGMTATATATATK
jgi:hypothetical protein